jgi:predicted RecA/RadA family phage recombinase
MECLRKCLRLYQQVVTGVISLISGDITMAKNYYEDGNTMDWHNSTGKDVVSGQPVAVGAVVGVANHDIPSDAHGVLMMTGVFVLPKVDTETWARGARLWLSADGKLTALDKDTNAKANTYIGTSWITTDPGTPEGHVRLGF